MSVTSSSLSKSASKFGLNDQDLLNIIFEDDNECIILENEVHKDLQAFILKNCSESQAARPHEVPGLITTQQRFLSRLGSVLTKENEKYVDNFINAFLTDGGFDDGIKLVCEPGLLELKIGKFVRAARADRECKIFLRGRATEIVYTIVENKRNDEIKNYEIQLAACMIAAMQYNYNNEFEEDVLGLLVTRSSFRFYRCTFNENYMKALENGIPISEAIVIKRLSEQKENKRPRKASRLAHAVNLNIIEPQSRLKILKYLSYFRSFAEDIFNRNK